jgi:hypothetical protein
MAVTARRVAGVKWQAPSPAPFDAGAHVWSQPDAPRVILARVLAKAARTLGLSRLATPRPAEFGLLVSMSPKIA